MDIQWYPGHMTRAKRQMQEDLKLVDMIIELVDARVPLSGRNPDIQQMGNGKGRLLILTKSDLADEAGTKAWIAYYRSLGMQVLAADTRQKASLKRIRPLAEAACREKRERDAKRGIRNRTIRAMVCGIPNVGKSTFINSLAGKSMAKTGDKPGVTRGKQWIHLSGGLDLMDTPGILWPKFDDPEAGEKLAMIGSISNNVYEDEELAWQIIHFLRTRYPGALADRYHIEETSDLKDAELLAEIARKRGFIVKGGEVSTERAAGVLSDEFRSGKLGRFTLDQVRSNCCQEPDNQKQNTRK